MTMPPLVRVYPLSDIGGWVGIVIAHLSTAHCDFFISVEISMSTNQSHRVRHRVRNGVHRVRNGVRNGVHRVRNRVSVPVTHHCG
jgi:divalent metal cation (Fe/Co/Zn/Cd) transporter